MGADIRLAWTRPLNLPMSTVRLPENLPFHQSLPAMIQRPPLLLPASESQEDKASRCITEATRSGFAGDPPMCHVQ